jgi:hypothetical protein
VLAVGPADILSLDEVERMVGMVVRAGETLRLRMADGRTVHFGAVKDMHELVDAVYEEILRRRQLPQALAAIQRGETVSVGPLLLRSDGIGDHEERWLAWDDVDEVDVSHDMNFIVVRRNRARAAWWSRNLANFNAVLLFELATALRRGDVG